jgi:hypothetical protein
MSVWEHKLTPGLVDALCAAIEFVHRSNHNRFHLQKDLPGLSKSAYNNFQKLRFHALVAKVDDAPGYWLITARGGQFLRGEIEVPRSVKTFRNKVVEHSRELIHIRHFRNAIPSFETRRDFLEQSAPAFPPKQNVEANQLF